MIDTLIFDMDGLLVDSEPYWKIAEKEIFGSLGLDLTDDLLRQVMGFRLSEVVAHWYNFKPWSEPNFKKTEAEIIEYMKKLLLQHGKALPGVLETLEYGKSKGFKMALASSSAMELIDVVVDKLGIRNYFSHLVSAENESFGKPHPAIFMRTATLLKSEPNECMVLEDSVNGMIAAKAARMHCLVVPETEKFDAKKFELADFKLRSLEHFTEFMNTHNLGKSSS